MAYSNRTIKVGAVVVLYNPNAELLKRCIHPLVPQVDRLCVVDNSEESHTSMPEIQNLNVDYFQLGRNIGIAAAQNIGIKHFQNLKYDFVLFCDQDSESPLDLVNNLLNAYFCLTNKYEISAIGPLPINRKTGKPYIYSQYIIKEGKEQGFEYYVMSSIMSSYSLVPMNNFVSVGLMKEELFIDFVDDEWCWRANYYNNKNSILIPKINISHELGISKKFCGMQINVSSPFRIYYQIRNLIWLSRKKYVPFCWKRKNIIKLMPKIAYYSFLPSNRTAYIKRMFKGLCDGLTSSLK